VLTHISILQVVIPLMAGPLCLAASGERVARWIALTASVLTFLISALVLQQVAQGGTIVYSLGGWPAPLGIEYRIDALNAWLLFIVSALGALVLFAAPASIGKEIRAERRPFFYVAYLLCLSGLLGIAATGDIFNVFVFLEISALASYTLIALGDHRRALRASFQYLIIGSIGATFILIGIGLMYAMTGTLNMQDLAQRLPAAAESRTVLTGFIFFIVGVCLKLALFPLHMWLPNAYTHAPSVVTAFLAATATKVMVYLLIRVVYTVFGVAFSFSVIPLQAILLGLSLAAIFVASTTAIFQRDVKRIFAWSSVAQIGYMVLGIGIGTEAGLVATLLHLFNHALMKGALFLALAVVVFRVGGVRLSDVAGLGKRMPWTMAAIVIGGLSLIGVPLTAGFVSKWYLVSASLQEGQWWLALLVLLGSLLSVVYVWRVIEAAYFQPPRDGAIAAASPGLVVPLWILAAANIYFGIDTRLPVAISEMAARALLGVSP